MSCSSNSPKFDAEADFRPLLSLSSGIGASAAFFTTAAAKEEGYGALLNVGIAYGMGIVRELEL